MKVPFIKDYFYFFNKNDEEIKKIINENICCLMSYTKIKYIENFDLFDYDYIVIFEKHQFESLICNDLNLYQQLKEHKKILYMCTYETLYSKIEEIHKNIIYAIKIYPSEFNVRKNIPNTTIFLQLNNKYNEIYNNKFNKFLNYLPSSIKIIDFNLIIQKSQYIIKGNNFPNKILSFNININNLNLTKKIKLPKNSIYVTNTHFMNLKTLNKIMSIFKNKKVLIIMSHGYYYTHCNLGKKRINVYSITYDNCKEEYNFIKNIYIYKNNDCNYINERTICDLEKKVINIDNNDLISTIIRKTFSLLDAKIYSDNIFIQKNNVLTLINSYNIISINKNANLNNFADKIKGFVGDYE
jgi:hypothetical protein